MPEAFPGEYLETPLLDAVGEAEVISMPRFAQRLDSPGQREGARPRSVASGERPEKVCCMRGVTSTHSRSKRIIKVLFAIMNVSNAAMGTGVLAFPLAYKQAGWAFGSILTLGYGVIMTTTLFIIAKAARQHDAISYQELLGRMFGQKTKSFLMYVVAVFVFFVKVSFLNVMTAQSTPIVRQWSGSSSAVLAPCTTEFDGSVCLSRACLFTRFLIQS